MPVRVDTEHGRSHHCGPYVVLAADEGAIAMAKIIVKKAEETDTP